MKRIPNVVAVVFLTAAILFTGCIPVACGDPISRPSVPPGFISYSNEEFAFSFAYPKGWIKEEENGGGPLVRAWTGVGFPSISVSVERFRRDVDLTRYGSTMASRGGWAEDYELLSVNDVTVAGYPGRQLAYTLGTGGDSATFHSLFVDRHGDVFEIQGYTASGDFARFQDTFAASLKSFWLWEPNLPILPPGESVTIMAAEPAPLDPAALVDGTSIAYAMEVFSGLVGIGPDLNVVPDIARSWDISADGTVYTFHLREDAKFHDGRPVKAQDVKYTLERACDPDTQSWTASLYLNDIVGARERMNGKAAHVSGVRVVDDDTVEVTIDAPKYYFLAKLANPVSYIVDQANVAPGSDWIKKPNGTGPYKIKEWRKDNYLILERNDLYYGGQPALRYALFRFWGGAPLAAYQTGRADMVFLFGSDEIQSVAAPASPLREQLVAGASLGPAYVYFDTSREPFDDVKVRLAFSEAIDKESLLRLLGGVSRKADGWLSPTLPDFNPEMEGLPFDPQAARRLLSESRYGDASKLPPVVFSSLEGNWELKTLVPALVDMWRQNLGVTVSVEVITNEEYAANRGRGDEHLRLWTWTPGYLDGYSLSDVRYYVGGAKDGGFPNRHLDELLSRAAAEPETSKRRALYHEIEQTLVDTAAALPLYFPTNGLLVKPHVRGASPPTYRYFLQYVSVDLR